ncbi:MAG: hypothetical protein JSV89_05675 [Spirochaetaceae bacterium]|nr:MAG: hypothetical protein JSV89_05675 [Spirochaetaceae bacterium]
MNKFISIFKIELQDLEEDINDLLEVQEKRKDSQEITNYVYMGNKGILLNEISAVRELLDSISTIDAYQYESVEAMIADVKRMLDQRIKDCAFPEVLHSLVQRKFEKVCTYVMGPENSQH